MLIPVEMLIEQLGLLEKDPKTEELESSLSAAVSSLVMLGLVERSGAAVVFHPLMQELVRTTLAHEACRRWAAAALCVVTGAFPEAPSESSSCARCPLGRQVDVPRLAVVRVVDVHRP